MKKTNRQLQKQGREAEMAVSSILRNLGYEYYVFDNVMFKTNNKGGTTQIDHIVVSPYGIFVIETKSHKGMIYGDCVSKNWVQCLYSRKGMLKNYLYSPYRQNFAHLKALYRLTGLPFTCFLGLIVFTSTGVNLSSLQCPNAIYAVYLQNVIYQHRAVLLTPQQVNCVISIIANNNIQSRYYDRKHVEYVKSLGGK